jgi:hypothetical protein
MLSVVDVFGEPASGASIFVSSVPDGANSNWLSKELITDSTGRIELAKVPAGRVQGSAWTESPVFLYGSADPVALSANGRTALAITVRPHSRIDDDPGGVGASQVAVDAVSADGRSLDFTLRIFSLRDAQSFEVLPCTPSSDDDAPEFQADCVAGPPGFDSAYSVVTGSGVATPQGGSPAAAFSAALLLDQSRHVAANDPWDDRLYDLKYFLISAQPTDRTLLAAFASDEPSGEPSRLPQQGVTMFPVGNPEFVDAGRDLFPTIDSFASVEGGMAPLYTSIDALLDFTEAHASASMRRAVVVLTDGTDDTCGTSTQCEQMRNRVGDKSRDLGIPIVAIVMGADGWWTGGGRAMAQLVERSGGIALWASIPSQLGPTFGWLPRILDGSATTQTAHFRIEAAADGTFQSGRTVFGSLSWGWGVLPFAVRIP